MPSGRRRHLPVPTKALFHNPNLVTFAPVPPAPAIRGRKDFNLGSALMVGHKVGLITGVKISSDGLHRRDTLFATPPTLFSVSWTQWRMYHSNEVGYA